MSGERTGTSDQARRGRPPEVPGKPRRNVVTVRLTDEGLAALDAARGPVSRAAYLRAALTARIRAR